MMEKIEQVAMYAPEMRVAQADYNRLLGMGHWIEDIVVAKGYVFGQPVINKAHLAFNYDLGTEFELIHYVGAVGADAKVQQKTNWLAARGMDLSKPFQSHMSYHVASDQIALVVYELQAQGVNIAQEVWTQSHTNPKLVAEGRYYHYVVMDTRDRLGFDLKLIERLSARYSPFAPHEHERV